MAWPSPAVGDLAGRDVRRGGSPEFESNKLGNWTMGSLHGES